MKAEEMNGQISISRPLGDGPEYISVELTDRSSRVRFCSVRVPLEGFMKALTGQGYIACEFELRSTELVGMVAQNKDELVPIPNGTRISSDSKWRKAMIAQMEVFEVDGWKGRDDDLWNHHNWVRNKQGEFQRVTFFRHVPKESISLKPPFVPVHRE